MGEVDGWIDHQIKHDSNPPSKDLKGPSVSLADTDVSICLPEQLIGWDSMKRRIK